MNGKILIILSMGILSFLFGSKNGDSHNIINSDNVELEDITSRIDPKEGWCDIYLKIVSDNKTDNSHIYIAKGLYKDDIVGIQVEIKSNISAGIVNGEPNDKGFLSDAVCLKSIGAESDNLVKALSELYQIPITKGFSGQIINANIFSLNENTIDLDERGYYRLKLFFEVNNEELYSELYLNINTEKKEIEIHEKDEGYRKSVIKVWTR